MGILGRILFVLAVLCFLGAAVALAGFVAGGFDFIDGGAAGATMAYVPVALAFGLAGVIAYAGSDAIREKKRGAG